MFRLTSDDRVLGARRLVCIALALIVLPACGARWSRDADAAFAPPVSSNGIEPGPGDSGSGLVLGESGVPGETPSGGSPSQPGSTGGSQTRTVISAGAGPHPGVSDKEIVLCVLMPETGASPLPTTWEKGVSAYWDYLKRSGGVYGRNIRLIIKDTKSDTAEALARARDCINEKAFSIYTMDRVEVMSALSKLLNDRGIPHLLAFGPPTPVMDAGSSRVNTFSATIDGRPGGRLTADYFSTGDLAGKRVAIVREDVQDTVPFAESFKARLRERGRQVVAEEAVSGQGNDFSQTILNLRNANAETVVAVMAPTPFIKLAQQAQAAAYHPIWFASAPSWTFDLVLQLGNANGALAGARGFSPWVALSSPAANTYKKAYAEMYPNETPDDIGLIGWGLGEVMHAALDKAGRDLGYNTLRSAFQSLKVTPKTWGPLDFRPNRRVGTDSVIEFREDGDHWRQVGKFRTSF